VSQEAREEIVAVCNEPRFRDQTPYEIVPQLLTEGRYLASESTIYRILRERDLLHHRSELRVRHRHSKPPERRATGSDQVYTWDITYTPSKGHPIVRKAKSFFCQVYNITLLRR